MQERWLSLCLYYYVFTLHSEAIAACCSQTILLLFYLQKTLDFTLFEAQPKPIETEQFSLKATSPHDLGEADLTNGNIEEAVLNQYLQNSRLEPMKNDVPQFSSSDTVNELLKGFKPMSPKETTQMLSMETEEVLPTFSRVLKQYSYSQGQPFTLMGTDLSL